jgi:hypothetical protein
MRSRLVFLILGSAALGGCAYGYGGYGSPYGGVSVAVGYGSGYGGYGYDYGGYGYGSGGYCSPYGYGSRYGCVDPYWGWQGGFYYPGTGYYVYDRYRRPYRWNDRQRRYWSERRQRAQAVTGQPVAGQPGTPTQRPTLGPNWEGFNREREATKPQQRGERRGGNPAMTQEQVQTRPEEVRIERPARIERERRGGDPALRQEQVETRPEDVQIERPARIESERRGRQGERATRRGTRPVDE